MNQTMRFKSVRTFAILGATIGALAGFVVGIFAGGSNIGNNAEPFAFFILILAIYGTILGSVVGYGLLTHKSTPAIRVAKNKKQANNRKRTITKDGWIIVDGERIQITPGSTVIVFEQASS